MIIEEMVQHIPSHDESCPDRSTYSLWSHENTVVKESSLWERFHRNTSNF